MNKRKWMVKNTIQQNIKFETKDIKEKSKTAYH